MSVTTGPDVYRDMRPDDKCQRTTWETITATADPAKHHDGCQTTCSRMTDARRAGKNPTDARNHLELLRARNPQTMAVIRLMVFK